MSLQLPNISLTSYSTGKIAWRLQLGSAFIPSFILGIGIFFCPEVSTVEVIDAEMPLTDSRSPLGGS